MDDILARGIIARGNIVAGETWQDKVERVRAKMKEAAVDALVVSALDESACLYILPIKHLLQITAFFLPYLCTQLKHYLHNFTI